MGLDHLQNPRLEVFVERPQFLETALGVEGNAGPALLEDERLRVLGDAFQQLDVATVAGFVVRLGEEFIGLALFQTWFDSPETAFTRIHRLPAASGHGLFDRTPATWRKPAPDSRAGPRDGAAAGALQHPCGSGRFRPG